jgi:hypothetical protein
MIPFLEQLAKTDNVPSFLAQCKKNGKIVYQPQQQQGSVMLTGPSEQH